MLCFTRVLDIARVFISAFDTNKLVLKTRVKTQEEKLEKCKKITQRQKSTRKLFYMCWVITRACCVFACVFAHKPYENATPTHSVIWALFPYQSCVTFFFFFLGGGGSKLGIYNQSGDYTNIQMTSTQKKDGSAPPLPHT